MSKRLFSLVATFTFAFSLSVTACGPGGGGDDDGADAQIPALPDEDGDGIADIHEGRDTNLDTDGDGTPDYLDDDSDGDGIPDYREGGDDHTGTPPVDSDGDGTPDFQDTDADNNGRPDGDDGVEDIDGDGIGNFADLDDDGDNILDVAEIGPSPAMPVDFDDDGTPDFQDIDSDNDSIKDLHEGAADPDLDTFPNYQDADSDGDCIGDALEAGDSDLNTPPVDTDGDLQRDFVDLDSDNDGLLDTLEDTNCNGVADGTESSRVSEDSDGDGVSDLIEEAAGTDPTNPADNPQNNGDFVFIVPYMDPPSPTDDTLDFSTTISQLDVVFGMDTSGSMGGELNNLKTSVSSLISTIRGDIPNTGFAVAQYEDFPNSPYGSGAPDQPFVLLHRVMTTNTASGLSSVTGGNGVAGLTLHIGGDSPESGWEMLHQVATGAGTSQGGASVPAFNPATAFPTAPPAGEFTGTLGGVGFRTGSLPVVVWITDACNHNSDGVDNYGHSAATRTQAVNELIGLSARVIALVSDAAVGGCGRTPRDDVVFAVNQTGAVVPPEAWGLAGARPSGCAVGQCCTGQLGVGEAPQGGQCPLMFRVSASGTGVGDAVATAVGVLTSFGLLDIGAEAVDDPSDSVDAVVSFVERIETNNVIGGVCATGLAVADLNSDTIDETFTQVSPGTTVCFDVVPKMNTTVMPLTVPQMFKATIVVEGDQVTTLDTRDIFFLVPPEIEDIPID